MRAIEIQEFGGPEVLELRELDDPQPGDGGVVIDVTAAGVNWADTHQADNTYLAPAQVPMVPGGEAVGTTPDGKRVVALLGGGGYAEKAVAHPAAMWEVPEGVTDAQALALVLQGTTAWHLLRTSAALREGESVVVHAAAGGVGTLAVQLAKRFGAGRVIGLASSEEKRELVQGLGADATVDSRADDLGEAIREANDGKRVDAVLHMSGGAAFDAELGVLAPLGRMVVFGIASREQREISTASLLRGSKAVIGFWLAHLLSRPDLLGPMIQDLLTAIAADQLTVTIGEVYPLSEAARAHENLIARRTTGKLLLDPSS
jgi:NADPH2:quinone reductase